MKWNSRNEKPSTTRAEVKMERVRHGVCGDSRLIVSVVTNQLDMKKDSVRLIIIEHLSILTCLVAGFVFTGSHLMWNPFSERAQKWGSLLSTIFTLSWLMFTSIFTTSHLRSNKVSNPSCPLTSVWYRREDISVVPHLRRFRTSGVFFLGGGFPVIFNYRRLSLMTGWSTTSVLARLTVDSRFFLLIFPPLSLSLSLSLSLLSQKFSL